MDVSKLPVQIITRNFVRPNLDVSYPSVVLANYITQVNINNEIAMLTNRMIIEQGYYQNPMTQLEGWYEIKTNERGLLSINIVHFTFSGGLHGMTKIKSLSFDVENGRSCLLSALFKPECDYVGILSQKVSKQIKERNISLLSEFESIKPNQDFYIADKSLVIFFQLYDITPFAFGFPIFPISIYELQDIIRDKPLLDKIAVNY